MMKLQAITKTTRKPHSNETGAHRNRHDVQCDEVENHQVFPLVRLLVVVTASRKVRGRWRQAISCVVDERLVTAAFVRRRHCCAIVIVVSFLVSVIRSFHGAVEIVVVVVVTFVTVEFSYFLEHRFESFEAAFFTEIFGFNIILKSVHLLLIS